MATYTIRNELKDSTLGAPVTVASCRAAKIAARRLAGSNANLSDVAAWSVWKGEGDDAACIAVYPVSA